MSQNSKLTTRRTIGVDLGDRFSHVAVLGPDGEEVVEEKRLRTHPKDFSEYFGPIPSARVVIEVGTHSPWISRLLSEAGHEVIVANARKVSLVFGDTMKTDRIDARKLAHVGHYQPALLHPIRHRGAGAQSDLAVLRARDAIVTARTRLVNHVRGQLKSSTGTRVRSCSACVFHTAAREVLPEALRLALEPVIDVIEQLTQRIRQYDRRIENLCKESYPETGRVRQVRGVGPILGLGFVLTLEDPMRFKDGRCVGAYLGLTPRQWESGKCSRDLRITKAGDPDLRRWLVSSAQYILGPFGEDCDLRRFGEKLIHRGGRMARKRAVVAVARKLASLLFALWKDGKPYEPLRQASKSEPAASAA